MKELNLLSTTSPFSDCGFADRREDHKPCVVCFHWHEWDSNPHSPRFKLGRYSRSRIVPTALLILSSRVPGGIRTHDLDRGGVASTPLLHEDTLVHLRFEI